MESTDGGPVGLDDPLVVVTKYSQMIPVSHEVLCDYSDHVCDESCPPPTPPPPRPPLATRVRYFLRRRWWGLMRLPGYRLVHKDDIGDPDDY
jgi:hypothetical protein